MNTSYPAILPARLLLDSPPRVCIFVAWIRQVMAKPKNSVSADSSTAVAASTTPEWIATLAVDGRNLRVAACSWYAARCLAMAAFGCDPGQLEVREDNCDKEETAP